MNLSDELFEQIVVSLNAGEATTLPDVTTAPADEQRRAGRRIVAGEGTNVRLIPLTDAIAPGPIDVALRDISPGGAGFIFQGRIALDEQFVLVLPSNDGQVAILCGVAYWQPLAENCFAIGARFSRVLRQSHSRPPSRPAAPAALVPMRRAM